MKNFFTLIFVFFLYSAHATNYYFSAVSGDDSRSSAQARSASTPWKTIGKVNSFFTSLLPGDSILLKRGEIFYGSITISKSGTVALPIVIGAYGTGNKPVITSLVTLGGWVSKGNGVWESYNSSFSTSVGNVLINNTVQEMGRYPNSDVTNKGYLTLESHTSNSITDNELNSYPNWTGAEMVIRKNHWITDRCLITNHSGSTLTFSGGSGYAANDKFGYFIQNDIKTLDKFGEWYYNPSEKKLSVYFGANTPSSYVIQATTISSLVSATKIYNVEFNNLNISGASSDVVNIRESHRMNIRNCDVSNAGGSGISLKYTDNSIIENCTVLNSNNNGIDLGYASDYVTVRNNKVTNSYVLAGMGRNGDAQGIGIFSNGKRGLFEYNEVRNTGYIAISFNGDSTVIKNNFVDSFCITKNDGAGIYTYLGSAAPYKGRKVTGNIILNGIGTVEGTGFSITKQAEGIYMDNNTSYVDITNNTVANCSNNGIYLHNANTIVIKNNTFYNNDKQLYTNQDNSVNFIRNITVSNNNFFSKYPDQTILNIRSSADDIDQMGRFDSNYYNRPMADWFIISANYASSGSRIGQHFDLQEWKDAYGKDAASKKAIKQIQPFKLKSLIGFNKFSNGTFSATKTGISPYNCTVSTANSGELDGSYVVVTPSSSSSSVFINVGELKANVKYILRYSMKGSVSSTMNIGASLRKAASPYNGITPIQYCKVNLSRSDNEIMFLSSAYVPSAQIVLKIDNKYKYYLDNVQLYEADATITNIDDSVRFEYNATQVSKTISLAGNYVDVKNNKYSNSIVLQPYTSAVLIKNGGITNTAPSVSITSPAANATFAAPASITITAAAVDNDGTISKVDFYNGSTFLGTDNTSPYTFTWNNVAKGNYSITAKATDNGSLVTASDAVPVSVYTPNVAPSVSITSPAANATFAARASITITAAAADSDGTISKVDFYNGNSFLGTDNTSPYSFTWNNVAAGNYSITAKATDNGSLVTASDAVLLSVYTPNVAPSVSITSPSDSAAFAAPASITITAAAADSDGSVSKVDFYNGDTLLATVSQSPYTFTWNNVAAGNYSITAKATDNGSLVTASAAVPVSVYTPNVAPSVSITSPADSATFAAPASITITAAAADNDGTISKVDFYNGYTLLATVSQSPYTFTWNNVAAGNYSITAKATDNGSLVTASDAVRVSVFTPNVAPSVSITSPADSATFASPASITITAAAADSDGTISKVGFYNGDTLLATVSQSPYTFTWNNVAAGNYSITAKATDNGSLVTASAAVHVSVYTPNVAPSVNLTSPVATAKYVGPATVTISANASDADGTISKVDFYNGSVLLKTEFTAPYTFSWSKVAAGIYTLTAKATDNKGLATTSAAVTIAVLKNKAPAVAITSPVTNATYNSPATINISVSATDVDGTISKVDIYNGTTLLRTERIAPYTYTWQNVPVGNYKIIAKATDNKGAVTTSAGVTVSVAAQNISLKPANNTTAAIHNVFAFDLRAAKVIKDNLEINDLKVFPNPAVSKIFINLNEIMPGIKKANVNIQNVSGVVFKSIPIIISGKTLEADVSSLRTGVYIISLVKDDLIISRKFVKN